MEQQQDFSRMGFVKSYLYPALIVFVIPVLSLLFFRHAEQRTDAEVREALVADIESDATMPAEERQAALKFFQETPMSRVMASNAPESKEVQNLFSRDLVFRYAMFRWAKRASLYCIVAGIVVFAVTGISVLFSMRSQQAQYLGLATGWHVLRLFSTFQLIAQAGLVVLLSFWVTALWFEMYFPRLIIIAALLAFGSVIPVVLAIFRRIDDKFEVRGVVLPRDESQPVWSSLARLSNSVGTEMPDQIIAGIDDNFFVTEQPITVDDEVHTGRTLFVSLSLLKKLDEQEAAAVMAHELAHFSGNDTVYSKKISPLLQRYNHYLEGLSEGILSRPVFYCAVLFRALFEISLGRLSRQREFRADRVAVEQTSATDVAHALLRITAYANYRGKVEEELFQSDKTHEIKDIPDRLSKGFEPFAAEFAEKPDVKELTTSHPFDSHPPLVQRLDAIGFQVSTDAIRNSLAHAGDGAWFHRIHGASELEDQQWRAYEEEFRGFHENVLAYRYLPANDDERAVVEKFFPVVEMESPAGEPLRFDCEKITYEAWNDPIYYQEITDVSTETEWGKPRVDFTIKRDKLIKRKLPLSKKQKEQQELFEVLQTYAGRYAAAEQYQKQLAEEADSSESASEE